MHNRAFYFTHLECSETGKRYEIDTPHNLSDAGKPLLARYDLEKMKGEIDRGAKRAGLVAFVEVKWRRNKADLDLAIDERRLARVAAAVECVAHDYATQGEDIRIDVILLAPGALPRHIANAWQP